MSTKEWVGVFVDLGCILYVYSIAWHRSLRWDWVLIAYGALNLAAAVGYWAGHDVAADRGSVAAAVLAISSIFFDLDGHGKNLWGKIKSAVLTAVNQASFRNQQKEAFS